MITVAPIHYTDHTKALIVDTTSRSTGWSKELSPFVLTNTRGNIVENFWQFLKVYPDQVDANGIPTEEWRKWAMRGISSSNPQRYPKGKGAKPLFHYYKGEKLGYVQARKKIYIPQYANAVLRTQAYDVLRDVNESGIDIVLLCFDGYQTNKPLGYVVHDLTKSMGHAFVLKMLLINDPILNECGPIRRP